MSLYAESSAVLSWLFGESEGDLVRRHLAETDVVCASELTVVECDRAFLRRSRGGEISAADGERLAETLARTTSHWTLVPVSEEIVARARRSFPDEPVRTLDAIHLSSALLLRSSGSDISVLALDGRVRRNGEALGFDVIP